MTTPEFIEWLDCKFRPYAGKLIPPIEVMEHRLRQTTRRKLSQKLTEDILRDAEFKRQVEEALSRRQNAIAAASVRLADEVRLRP